MKKIVISIGGSVITNPLTRENFRKYANIIKKISKNNKVFVVVGGGKICRKYQSLVKAPKKDLDYIGILTTHLNAKTFSCFINKSFYVSLKSEKEVLKEVVRNLKKYNVFVLGGYETGHSTDYDAVIVAKAVKADLIINVSNVDYVYDKDPKICKDAKKFEKISFIELVKIVRKLPQKPGKYKLFDLKAAKILEKIKIKTVFVGRKPENIIKAIKGEKVGTIISDYV